MPLAPVAAASRAVIPSTEHNLNITRSAHGAQNADLSDAPVKALTTAEEPVQDAGSETQAFDRNAFVYPVKHSGKVQIWR